MRVLPKYTSDVKIAAAVCQVFLRISKIAEDNNA